MQPFSVINMEALYSRLFIDAFFAPLVFLPCATVSCVARETEHANRSTGLLRSLHMMNGIVKLVHATSGWKNRGQIGVSKNLPDVDGF